jgi:hypothetical protein
MAGAVMIREAVVRYRGTPRAAADKMSTPIDAVRFVRKLVAGDAREHFLALLLDGRQRPIDEERARRGAKRSTQERDRRNGCFRANPSDPSFPTLRVGPPKDLQPLRALQPQSQFSPRPESPQPLPSLLTTTAFT